MNIYFQERVDLLQSIYKEADRIAKLEVEELNYLLSKEKSC